MFSQEKYRSEINGFCPIHMDFVENLKGAEASNCYVHHSKPNPIKINIDPLLNYLNEFKKSFKPIKKRIEVRTLPVKLFKYKIKPLKVTLRDSYLKKSIKKRRRKSK